MSINKTSIAGADAAKAAALPVPRNATALMQHLQLLVGREGYRFWCGGFVSPEKLLFLVQKFDARYPIAKNARQRAYDRTRGRAVVHFVVFRDGENIAWWLLSDGGQGGLRDPSTPDAHVAKDAHSREGHIEFRDYVLLYAAKKEPRTLTEKRTGKLRTILKETSSWTWKIRGTVVSELRASLRECCERLDYGDETRGSRLGWGLRGFLAAQRQRPLFSGVRTQVIQLHRDAADAWEQQRPKWLRKHPVLASKYGERAGALRPLIDVVAGLPKMVRIRVFEEPGCCVADLRR